MPPPAPSLLVSQPSEETEEELDNLMEDSGHGLDIGSEAAMDDSSRVVNTSDEENMEVDNLRASRGVERRRPRRSRVAYKVQFSLDLRCFCPCGHISRKVTNVILCS